uniref:hypothetical protein n=1 Tax=Alloprevotella sp. TaxID=1872471 RepID=UPI0040290782
MISLRLDRFDFVSAVEGFARGSHLQQHVWEQIVYPSIPQMSLDEMDFLWYVFRRDLWDNYFYDMNGRIAPSPGHKDYLHTLAAMHRGNRYLVTCKTGKFGCLLSAVCYRFNGEYYALYANVDDGFQNFVRLLRDKGILVSYRSQKYIQRYNSIIPTDWIQTADRWPILENRYVQSGKEDWWYDLNVYDHFLRCLQADAELNNENKNLNVKLVDDGRP